MLHGARQGPRGAKCIHWRVRAIAVECAPPSPPLPLPRCFWTLTAGSLFTLRRKDLLRSTGITHVLSVLGLPLDNALFEGFQHKVVEVDDTEDENLIQYFPACNRFIQAAIDAGGAVLVHW